MPPEDSNLRWRIQLLGLILGPVAAMLAYRFVPNSEIQTLSGAGEAVLFGHAGRATLGVMLWMGIWWITEAIDITATAMIPLAILPLVTVGEYTSSTEAVTASAAPYANRFIALFLGGFILALSMERWGLHRRIALLTLRLIGTKPRNIIAGFMAITAVMSMWVSNTATTVTMLPIALSVAVLLHGKSLSPANGEGGDGAADRFATCLMLGIAYAASVGGMGTLIGTAPNALLAAFIYDTYEIEISFVQWLMVGGPMVAVFTPIIWVVLTRFLFRISDRPIEGGGRVIEDEYRKLGKPNRGEIITFIVFAITATAWVTRPLLNAIEIKGVQPLAGLSDPVIAIIAAISLFIIPVDLKKRDFVMNWETAQRLPWGILILLGGGLSLASAVTKFHVSDFIGLQAEALSVLPGPIIVLAVAAGIIFLTELTSNTATTATMLPILAGIAPTLGIDPFLLIVPAAIASSCAFMMPVATPPNAIVFASGYVTIPQMCRAGLWLNVIGIALVTILAYTLVLPVLGAVAGP